MKDLPAAFERLADPSPRETRFRMTLSSRHVRGCADSATESIWYQTMSNEKPRNHFCGRTRREFLWETGGAFSSVALSGLLGSQFFAKQSVGADGNTPFNNPLAPQEPHFAGKAKSVIFLFMYGGPSQIDTFDYKPNMYGMDGKIVPIKTFGRGGKKNEGRVVEPKWKFKQYGECGKWVSDLFPHLATRVQDPTNP